MATGWTWAALNDDQVALVAQAEDRLDADYLLVYQPVNQADEAAGPRADQLHVAPLDPGQLAHLQQLELQLQAVVVAYKQK